MFFSLKQLLTIAAATAGSSAASAQYAISDSSFLSNAILHIKTLHSVPFHHQQHLFNGNAYKETPINKNFDIGHPFFGSENMVLSNLEYDGVFYEAVPLLYDLLQDQVATVLPGSNVRIALVNRYIGKLIIGKHIFEYVDTTHTLTRPSFDPGIYEVLLDTGIKVYAKRKKVRSQSNQSTSLRQEFLQRDEFFVSKNGEFTKISSKKTLLETFESHANSLNEFLKKSKVRFSKSPERAIIAAAKFYQSIPLK